MLAIPIQRPVHLKICGITRPDEIGFLDEIGVNYAGLWSGVPKGLHDLSVPDLKSLCRHPRQALKLVLVTLHHSFSILEALIKSADLYGIQLHGFQMPSLIRRIRGAFGDTIKIFKVLHVKNDRCTEDHLIERYLQAGVDCFIIDTFKDQQHIGSTGVTISDHFLQRFISARIRADQIMIAGGVDETNIGTICRNYRPFGVDIDTGARVNGKISKRRVTRIVDRLCDKGTLLGSAIEPVLEESILL